MKNKIFVILAALVLVLGFSLALALPAAAGTTWYVDPLGTDDLSHGTGTGADAFLTIGYALNQASSGDTINVAEGTYYENITLKAGVTVQGAGAGHSFIDGSSSGTVVYASGLTTATTLDGFTIQHGRGYFDSGSYYGGGMYAKNCTATLTVSHCDFTDNNDPDPLVGILDGGGIYCNNCSSLALSYCNFTDNFAWYGGGIYSENSSLTLTECDFTDNKHSDPSESINDGGGIYNDNCSLELTDCNFSGNQAGAGAGIYSINGSSLTLDGCTFTSNSGSYQGAGMNSDGCSLTLSDCDFTSNTATTNSGGMLNYNCTSLELTGCDFDSNQAQGSGDASYGGGGMYNYGSSPTLSDCAFTDLPPVVIPLFKSQLE